MKIEFAENPQTRVPVILLLDVSFSMKGEKIKHLKEGVDLFIKQVNEDPHALLSLDLMIIKFSDKPEIISNFKNVDEITVFDLEVHYSTNLGEALIFSFDQLELRKNEYRDNNIPYYRPWLICITDGEPTDNIEEAAEILKQKERNKEITTYMIGVGDFDRQILSKLTTTDVYKLKGINFNDLFLWLSSSMRQVSISALGEDIQNLLPPVAWNE